MSKKFLEYAEELMDFFEDGGVKLNPRPEIVFDSSPASRFDPFVPTGHYDYRKNRITLHVSNRQCKDILRTLAHELIHHSQYLSDPEGYRGFDKKGRIADNAALRKYEEDAYGRGNILFREWTEDRDA